MNCLNPACKSPETKVGKSIDEGTHVTRYRKCTVCGWTFSSREVGSQESAKAPKPEKALKKPLIGKQAHFSPDFPISGSRGGVGGGLSSGLSGSGKIRDPNPAVVAPPERARVDELWTPHRWRTLFGAAWCARYQQIAYGMTSDAKACGALGDLLAELPPAAVLAAQARAGAMFAAFLGSSRPALTKARHPFVFFVTEFGGLRVDELPATPSFKPSEYPDRGN